LGGGGGKTETSEAKLTVDSLKSSVRNRVFAKTAFFRIERSTIDYNTLLSSFSIRVNLNTQDHQSNPEISYTTVV